MLSKQCILVVLSVACFIAHSSGEEVRIATYNIRFLNTDISGPRMARIRNTIGVLNADIIALQEIDDRAALEKIFDEQEWLLVIDDDSGENQDLAIAAKKSSIEFVNIPADLDADDEHFLFPDASDNFRFPDRRDVLNVRVRVKATGDEFHVLCVHQKSRFGGRDNTDVRRVEAARALVDKLEREFDGVPLILLGDKNDNPDDISVSILETGDPMASAEAPSGANPFLFNLCEPLLQNGHVSSGRTEDDIVNNRINTQDFQSRTRNNTLRGTNTHTGDILFDQLLVTDELFLRHISGSTRVLDAAVAASGSGRDITSDHLPVFADFDLRGDLDSDASPVSRNVRLKIAALLPNPTGVDAGNEEVHIINVSTETVDLAEYGIRDRQRGFMRLFGNLAAGETEIFTLPADGLTLTNRGDRVTLFDDSGNVMDQRSYSRSQATAGSLISFE